MDTIKLIALLNEASEKYGIKYVIPMFDAEEHRVKKLSIRFKGGGEEIFDNPDTMYKDVRSYLLKQ